MNVVYRCEWTEYERGFGRLHDGVTYAMSEVLLDKEITRREGLGDYDVYSRASNKDMVIVTDDLAAQIHAGGGILNTIHGDDPGFLGFFKPRDPKANIETYRASKTAPKLDGPIDRTKITLKPMSVEEAKERARKAAEERFGLPSGAA
jgi:hypothetical protein